MENLIPKIITWAEERNIVRGSNVERETLKLVYKSGKLIKYLDNGEVCINAIGQCIVQLIIICHMRHTTLDQCLNFTKKIKDDRVAESVMATLMVFKTLGELAENISEKNDIKGEIGYLLIYLTALTNSLNLSIKECTEDAYNEIMSYKGIMFDGKFLDETDSGYKTAKAIIDSRKQSIL